MGLLSRIFGTEKALEGVVSGVSKGLDALVYTDEEKAQAAAEDRSEARKMVVGWMEATQGQNLARRLIALIVTGIWVTQYLVAMCLNFVSVWATGETQTNLITSASILSNYASEMNGAMMLILAFYFAAPHMDKIVVGALDKFGGNKKAPD